MGARKSRNSASSHSGGDPGGKPDHSSENNMANDWTKTVDLKNAVSIDQSDSELARTSLTSIQGSAYYRWARHKHNAGEVAAATTRLSTKGLQTLLFFDMLKFEV